MKTGFKSLTNANRQGGFALVLTAILSVLAMGIWTLAHRSTHDNIISEGYFLKRENRDASSTRALVRGVSLLRTGFPPTDPYACLVSITGEEGSNFCTVTYAGAGLPGEWTVLAAPSTDQEARDLPSMPESFD